MENEPRSAIKAPITVPPLKELMLAGIKAPGITEKALKNKDDFSSSDLATWPMPIRPST